MTVSNLVDTLEVCGKLSKEQIDEFRYSYKNKLAKIPILSCDLRRSEIRLIEEGMIGCKIKDLCNILYALEDIEYIFEKKGEEYDKFLLDIVSLSEVYRKDGRYVEFIIRNMIKNSQFLRLFRNKEKDLNLLKICDTSYAIKVRYDNNFYTPYSEHGNGVEHTDSNIDYFTLMRYDFGENINEVALMTIDDKNKVSIFTYYEIKTQDELGEMLKNELKRGIKLAMVDYMGDCMTAFFK